MTLNPKIPVSMQAVFGFAMLVLGAAIMLYAPYWSQGDIRWLAAFQFTGALYLINGIPSMVEGFMTMFYKKE